MRRLFGLLTMGTMLFSASAIWAFYVNESSVSAPDVMPEGFPPWIHWDLREFPTCAIPYSTGPVTTDVMNADDLLDASFVPWMDVSPAMANVTKVTALHSPSVARDQENRVFWDSDICNGDIWDDDISFGNPAKTYYWFHGPTGRILETDIVFNDQTVTWTDGVQQDHVGDDTYDDVAVAYREPLSGGNGVCDEVAVCDDVQVIPAGGMVSPGGVCVTGGSDSTMNTVINNWKSYDLRVVATHEAGHFFGLGHTPQEANILGSLLDGPYILAPGATLSFLFGPPPSTQTVNVTFTGGTMTAAQVAMEIQAAADAVVPGQVVANASQTGGLVVSSLFGPNDLVVTGGTATTSLSLLPNESGIPTMNYTNSTRRLNSLDFRTLSRDDVNGLNFLWTPDMGDAPDPWVGFNRYPTKTKIIGGGRTLNGLQLAAPAQGPVHLFGYPPYRFEWLGENDSESNPNECEALTPDSDVHDDGVQVPNLFYRGLGATITATIRHNSSANRYSAGPEGRILHFNGYLDFNGDGIFQGTERLLFWSGTPQVTGDPNATCQTVEASLDFVAPATCTADIVTLQFNVLVPTNAANNFYCRFRLDYGENEGRVENVNGDLNSATGVAQFGEVEDYACQAYTLPRPTPRPRNGRQPEYAPIPSTDL